MADSDNIQVQKQLNDLLEQRKKTVQDTTRLLQQQATVARQITESLASASSASDFVRLGDDVMNAMRKASEGASELGEQSQMMADATAETMEKYDEGFEGLVERYREATEETSLWGAKTTGIIKGGITSFTFLGHVIQTTIGFVGTLAKGFVSIGMSILSIPFKVFNSFIDEANKLWGGVELWKQYEEIRKAFGNFREDVSQNVIKSARSMKGELANTGLSVFRVTGFIWDRLRIMRELAQGMGATFHQFGKEIADNSEVMVAYQKGLGQTNETMKSLAQFTQGTGETFEMTLRTVTKFSTGLGRQFGISQKVIARDVGEMTQDLQKFGSIGVRQMAQLSTFTRRLGIDFKELLGIVDKFDNFEDAADSAARLAQAFGINIDAMKMIKEQDPGKRIEMLREGFFAAGKSIENLTRQERNYLAQTSGISDQALNAVFALENQGKTYEEIAQAGEVAEQSQLTQAEAMKRLADSIERVVLQGRRMGGFWDRFVMGFRRGMRWTSEFRGTMRNIHRSLWKAEIAGRQVGRAFIKLFPGMKQFIDGVRSFFDPKKFKQMADGVVGSLRTFFKELGDPKTAEQALSNLFKALHKTFMGMVGSQESAMSKIIAGVKTGLKAVGQIILSGVKIAMENLTKLFKVITKVIRGETSFGEAFKEMFDKGMTGGMSILSDIWFEVSRQLRGTASALWDAFKEIFAVAWEKIKVSAAAWWKEIGGIWGLLKKIGAFMATEPVGQVMATILFGPAFVRAGISLAGASVKAILNVISRGATNEAAESAGKSIGEKMFRGIGGVLGKGKGSLVKMGGKMGGFLAQGVGSALSAGGATMLMTGGLIAAAGALVGAIGIKTYQAFSEVNKVGRQINETAKALEQINRNRDIVLDQHLKNLNIEKNTIEELRNIERSRLGERIEGMRKEKDFTEDQIKEVQEKVKIEAKSRLDQLIARQQELEFKRQEKRGLGGFIKTAGGLIGPSEEEISSEIAMLRKKSQEAQKELASIDAQFAEARSNAASKEADAANQQELMKRKAEELKNKIRVGEVDMSEVEFGMYDKIKKMKPEQVKKVVESFRKDVVPTIMGMKDDLVKIGQAFSETDVGQALLAVESIKQFESAYIGLQQSIGSAKGVKDEMTKLNQRKDVQEFSKAKVMQMPAVQAIGKMVEIANTINKELSNISDINVAPKLENLGRALGFVGGNKLTLEHENFNVNLNVKVELDPTKLADAVVDTGRVMKGPKALGQA